MLVTQVSRPAILMGRLAADGFRVTVQSTIIIALAYLLGFRFQTGVAGFLVTLFIIAFFGFAWSGISLTLGMRTKSAETVFGIGAFLTFPLLFMSSSLVPLSAMPNWIQDVSKVNPISFAVTAVRDMALPNAFSLSAEVSALAVIALIAILTMGATIYMFRKVVS